MPLDPRYVIAPSLQEYFVDKTTGLPLTNGMVFFYSDVNRAQLKPVFTLSGTPPNYSYVQLPNPMNLSAVGTSMDANGNDILTYYFPYDDEGNVELYYIVVTDSDGAPQFTRSGYPNFIGTDIVTDVDIVNYIPNGQFLTHLNLPPGALTPAGRVQGPVTTLGPGGWTYERTIGSTATDNISFTRFSPFVSDPTASPRYAVNLSCAVPGVGDAFKYLCVKFDDVNKFASDTQQYTFGFEAVSNTSALNVTIELIKYFGVGGSATQVITVPGGTFTIQPGSYQDFSVPITFGTNAASTLGTGDDDYVQIAISFPPSTTFNASFSDFVLTAGSVTIATFPTETNADMLTRSIAGWMNNPDFDGFDLYLPPVLTPAGMIFDTSEIGKIVATAIPVTAAISPDTNELLCDGAQYLTSGYSPLGIPYARLQRKLTVGLDGIPRYGTGSQYFTTYHSIISGTTVNNQLRVTTNIQGIPTNAADVSTGFTFATITPGRVYSGASGPLMGHVITNGFVVYNPTGSAVSVGAPTAGTSGFSVADNRNITAQLGNTLHVFTYTTIAATTLAGKYITFRDGNNGLFYLWFTVNGAGADPAPGGTGIKLDLLSTYNAQEVAACVANAISGYQLTTILTTAGSTITASSYFRINSLAQGYYVWYVVSGAGIDPNPGGGLIGIRVDILTSDTNIQVAEKTMAAMNGMYFAVPNLQGMFLRGLDPLRVYDVDAISRVSMINTLFGNQVGTVEYDTTLDHNHVIPSFSFTTTPYTAGATPSVLASFTNILDSSHFTGLYETRPINNTVQWLIKY